ELIKKYREESDEKKKNRIFNDSIYPLLFSMAEIIGRRYKLIIDEGSVYNAVEFAYRQIDKWDHTRGSGYTFFSWVIKNRLIQEKMRSDKRLDNVELTDEMKNQIPVESEPVYTTNKGKDFLEYLKRENIYSQIAGKKQKRILETILLILEKGIEVKNQKAVANLMGVKRINGEYDFLKEAYRRFNKKYGREE